MMSEMGEHFDQVNEMIHEYKGSSSSSDSDNEKPSSHSSKKKHLFGRKEPVHAFLGGGKCMILLPLEHLFTMCICCCPLN